MSSDPAQDRRGSANARVLFLICGAVASAVSLLIAWQWGLTTVDHRSHGIPLIAAADWPAKRLPEQPGGVGVPHVNLEFYSILDGVPEDSWQEPKAAVAPSDHSSVELPSVAPPTANPRESGSPQLNAGAGPGTAPLPRPER